VIQCSRGSTYHAAEIPHVDLVAPGNLEYDLGGTVHVWLNILCVGLFPPNGRSKITEHGQIDTVSFRELQWTRRVYNSPIFLFAGYRILGLMFFE
jgi:hypothetical protein